MCVRQECQYILHVLFTKSDGKRKRDMSHYDSDC